MSVVISILLLAFFASGASAACVEVPNDDMVEYSCSGGYLLDLDTIPSNAEKIQITGMPILAITSSTFSRFGANLWVLICTECQIRAIDTHALSRLINLQQLILNNNRLTTIKAEWFERLDSLTYLDLNYNNIETIEPGVFKNLPSLVELRISGNRLTCLNLEDMSHSNQLKRIFLTENPNFQCPNAVDKFLTDRGVNFEKDHFWDDIQQDLIHVEIPPMQPFFHERLHPQPTARPEYTDPNVIRTSVPTPPPYPEYTDRNIHTSVQTPPSYPEYTDRNIHTSVPTAPPYPEYTDRNIHTSVPTPPPYPYTRRPPSTPGYTTMRSRPTPHYHERPHPTTPQETRQEEEEEYYDETEVYPPNSIPVQPTYHTEYRSPSPVIPVDRTTSKSSPDSSTQRSMVPYHPDIPGPTQIIYPLDHMTPNWGTPEYEDSKLSSHMPYPTYQTSATPVDTPGPPPPIGIDHWMYTTDPDNPSNNQPMRENENEYYGQPSYSEATRPPLLAPSHDDRHETFAETDVAHSESPRIPWTPNIDDSAMDHPFENRIDPFEQSSETHRDEHVIRPVPNIPESIQPASPDGHYQAPYDEPTVTIRPPPENYRRRGETSPVVPIETTTDKPLPECPNRNFGTTLENPLEIVAATVLMVILKRVLVEGF